MDTAAVCFVSNETFYMHAIANKYIFFNLYVHFLHLKCTHLIENISKNIFKLLQKYSMLVMISKEPVGKSEFKNEKQSLSESI